MIPSLLRNVLAENRLTTILPEKSISKGMGSLSISSQVT